MEIRTGLTALVLASLSFASPEDESIVANIQKPNQEKISITDPYKETSLSKNRRYHVPPKNAYIRQVGREESIYEKTVSKGKEFYYKAKIGINQDWIGKISKHISRASNSVYLMLLLSVLPGFSSRKKDNS